MPDPERGTGFGATWWVTMLIIALVVAGIAIWLGVTEQ